MALPGEFTLSRFFASMFSRGRCVAALAPLVLLALLGGCATSGAVNPRDPFEASNRVMFDVNDGFDKVVLKPVAQAYRAVLPQPVRTGVRNFFGNLQDPWHGINNLLQGKVEDGLTDWFRFATNSTIGLGGVMDVASTMRMTKHNEDFGQTLGVWGFESGPYLVLPLFGPSTVRDGLGLIVDAYGFGGFWLPRLIDPPHRVAWRNSLSALDLVSFRAGALEAESIFEAAALDRYSFMRDAYLQRRQNLLYDGNPPPEPRRDEEGDAAAPRTSLETEPSRWIIAHRNTQAWGVGGDRGLGPRTSSAAYSARVVEPTVPANYAAVIAASASAAPLLGDNDE
jgi:phospholipid-binding lipoprotein MlaA